MSVGVFVTISSRGGVSGRCGVVIIGLVMVSDMGIDGFSRSCGNKGHENESELLKFLKNYWNIINLLNIYFLYAFCDHYITFMLVIR